ncbi:hypothetical protein C8F04DRAFT_1190522 [Mycena alexandri]|uniref:Uncharacterized protein n=1 Tax=Mycena alexandri TaxID=1745969 RepID=A0AAD6SGL2_9AGAR|nr:hypothetical protein C8F04DRAFT_1190522 [Mycena alexandri]
MSRHTRQGTQFSPYDTFSPVDIPKLLRAGYTIHHTTVSLEELFEAAEAAADTRAQQFEDAEEDDGGSEWEEVDDSRPSTPEPQDPLETLHVDTDLGGSDPLSSGPAASGSGGGCAAHRAAYKRKHRAERRQKLAQSPFTRHTRPRNLPTHRVLPAKTSSFDARDFQTSEGGHWIGADVTVKLRLNTRERARSGPKSRESPKSRRLRELYELLAEGYEYLCLDGKNPLLILDPHGRIIVVFGGMPEDPEWLWVVCNATEAMKEAREEGFRTGAFSAEDSKHRRGDEFTPLTGGTSFGGGQKFAKAAERAKVQGSRPEIERGARKTIKRLAERRPAAEFWPT